MTFGGVFPEYLPAILKTVVVEGKPVVVHAAFNPLETNPDEAQALIAAVKEQYPALRTLYLSTPTPTLLQRFAKAEKSHPYHQGGSLKDVIDQEQALYRCLKPLGDYHIDTSTTTAGELGLKIAKILNIDVGVQPMSLHLVSFGFKHGVPTDAEMVFDMRFLPNPFYDEALRPFTGLDASVKDYIFGFPEAGEFLQYWQNMMAHVLPMYQKQGKTRVSIAIGCTGGQHRSVAMTMALAEFLKTTFPEFEVATSHREQSHWPKKSPDACSLGG